MANYSVPSDFKTETLDAYDVLNQRNYNGKITETYGQLTVDNKFGSGRANRLLPVADMSTLEKYICYSKKRGIKFNYTFNATCYSNYELTREGQQNIKGFLQQLEVIGVDSITVANQAVMELIMQNHYQFDVKVSTTCMVNNVNKALSYQKMGISRIVLDESINRDFYKLKQIRDYFGTGTEIIVNVVCHNDCIYELFHHNQTSHDVQDYNAQFFSLRCARKRFEAFGNIFRMTWIRPEDIKHYEKIGISLFKIQGRQAAVKGNIYNTVYSYVKEDYTGNLLELLDCFDMTNSFVYKLPNKELDGFLSPFLNEEDFCSHNCSICGYCDRYAYRFLNEYNESILRKAQSFYNAFDVEKI